MTTSDDNRPGDEAPPLPLAKRRPGQRRAWFVAGAAGLAAALGGGAYVIMAGNFTASSDAATQNVQLSKPLTSGEAAMTNPDPAAAKSGTPSPVPTVDSAGSPLPSKVVNQIKEAREKSAKSGVKVLRPVTPKRAAPVADLQQTQAGSVEEGGVIRVLSGRGDLTGHGELGYIAGGITSHGPVDCSQTFKFATDPKPEKKPNLLMCWRTTAKKSVAAIVVDYKGDPSRARAMKAIDTKWRSMG